MFVDVPPELAAKRVAERGRHSNTLEFLTRLRDGFASLPEMRYFQVEGESVDQITPGMSDTGTAEASGGRHL